MSSFGEPRSTGRLTAAACLGRTVAVLSVLAVTACHPLLNPADPNSTTYTGIPADTGGTGEAPEPLLPSADKWQLVTFHNPGRPLPLDIPDDESFVEPRDAGSFELWITLSDSFVREEADKAILWVGVTNGASTFYAAERISDIAVNQRRLVKRFDEIGFPFDPNQSWITLRLTDRNGTAIGERVLGYLIGDVDGDGTVAVAPDHAIIVATAGFAVGTDDPDTIRSDLDINGLVEANPGNDWNVVNVRNGDSLPPRPAEFWD